MKALNRNTLPELTIRPERIIQFGKGNFLRAFAEWVVQRMNNELDFEASIAVVEATSSGGGEVINEQDGLYHLILEGIENGEPKRRVELIDCMSRCVSPYYEYETYQALVDSPDVRFIISNTTEAGIQWADGETLDMTPQPSFPGKITALLHQRFKTFDGATDKGMIIFCCELIEDNADRLKEFVLRHAENWDLSADFITWLEESCAFCSSLVDRIVPGFPSDKIAAIQQEIGFEDNLVVVSELYHNWVIKAPAWVQAEFPAHRADLNVTFVDEAEQQEIREQKVRILNGSHTGSFAAAYLSGLDTVREAMEDTDIGNFVNTMVAEEIVPNIPGDQSYLQQFSQEILERFHNPFIRHEWLSISLNAMSKWETRVLPSLLDAQKHTGELPKRIVFSLAALIAFYRGQRGEETYACKDNADIIELYTKVWSDYNGSEASLRQLVTTVLAYEVNWKCDLNQIPSLTEAVTDALSNILNDGMLNALKQISN